LIDEKTEKVQPQQPETPQDRDQCQRIAVLRGCDHLQGVYELIAIAEYIRTGRIPE
jgi:hypothetical protein